MEKETIHQYIVASKLKTPRLSCGISRHCVWQEKNFYPIYLLH